MNSPNPKPGNYSFEKCERKTRHCLVCVHVFTYGYLSYVSLHLYDAILMWSLEMVIRSVYCLLRW